MGESGPCLKPHPVRMGSGALVIVAKVNPVCQRPFFGFSHHSPALVCRAISTLVSGSLGSVIGPE
jgi:hypothetical protein